MAEKRPAKEYVAEPNVLERSAAAYLQRVNTQQEARLRECRPEDLASIRSVERWGVFWAFLAGAVSGAILGATEIFVRQGYLEGMEGLAWREQLPYWAAFLGLALLVSGVEILFLYWNALRAVARISRIAGLPLSGNHFGEFMARGLARAALEFPNPRDPLYRIDPYARTPHWKLATIALLYRMKVGATSFVLRVLLRRMAGRAALRGVIPLITGPLYAIWNAIITWRIVREGRVRSLGPLAVQEVVGQIAASGENLSPEDRHVVLAAAGEMIIRSEDAHPNFALLLCDLMETLEVSTGDTDVDWPRQQKRLRELGADGENAVLKALILTSLLDGRVPRAEIELLQEAHAACGRSFQKEAFDRLNDKLMNGVLLKDDDFEAVWKD
jgi:hypothetical protein